MVTDHRANSNQKMTCDLLTMNWEEISLQNPEKLVVFLGIAPIEEHGRHLPIGVDFYETRCWIDGAVSLLAEELPGYRYGTLPVIPLGFADMGLFPGNIHVSRELVFNVVFQTIKAVANWGVKNIIVISGHADPMHSIAIEQACEKLNNENGMTAIAPMGSIFNGHQKGIASSQPDELAGMAREYPNDFHAGWIETSCMLDIAPEYVSPNYKTRPDISLSGRDMMDPGRTAAAISGEGHIGYPSRASAALGAMLNIDMSLQIKEAVTRFLAREGYECYEKHPLYNILGHMKTDI